MTVFVAAVLLCIAFVWRPIGTVVAEILAEALFLLMLLALFGTAKGSRKPLGVSILVLAVTAGLPMLFPPLPAASSGTAAATVVNTSSAPAASGGALAFTCPTPDPTETMTAEAAPMSTEASPAQTQAPGGSAGSPTGAAMPSGCPTATVLAALHADGDPCANAGERYTVAGFDLVCADEQDGSVVWMERATADQLAAERASQEASADAQARAEAPAAADAKASADAAAAAAAKSAAAAQAQQQTEGDAPAQTAAPGEGTGAVPVAVTPGAFCSASLAGSVGYTKTGLAMYCTKDPSGSRYRWRQ